MDEKKEYSVVGTVTIGTDEYRDLLTEKFEAEKDKSVWNDKWYKEYLRANDLEKQVSALKAKMEKCEKFIKDRYKNTESTDNGPDIVALFMRIFGEE